MTENLLAEAERRAEALRTSGLPACHSQPGPFDSEGGRLDPLRYLNLLKDHERGCPVCLARRDYLARQFGPRTDGAFLTGALALDRLQRIPTRGPLLIAAGIAFLCGGAALVAHALLPDSIGAPIAWTMSMIGMLGIIPAVYFAVPARARAYFPGWFASRFVAGTVGVLFFDTMIRLWDHSSPLSYLISSGRFAVPLNAAVAGLAIALVWPVFARRMSGA